MAFRHLANRTLLLVLALALAGCGGAEARKAKYLERGKAYLEQENYDKAAIELKNVLQIDPRHAEAYLLLAEVEEQRNNHRQAFGAYAKAVELAPENPRAQARLGRYYLLAGETAKAAELADALLAKHPNDSEGRVLRAAVTLRQGDEAKALSQASAVLAEHPGDADAAQLVSTIHQKRKDLDKAIATLDGAIRHSPKDVSMRQQLARLHAGRGSRDKTEQILREVIAIEPQKLSHRVTLAAFLAQTDQVDRAEKVLREAIEADPADPQRRLVLAELLANRRGFEQAEQELQRSIGEISEAAPLRFALGALYERKAMPEKAAETYRKLIADHGTKPDGLRARNALGDLLYRQGQYDQAADVTAEVLKENPRDNLALLLKGKLALQKGDGPGAIASFRSVLKDQPDSPDVLGLLGEAHALNREPELAREHFHKAVEANPRNVAGRLRYARFLAGQGDHATALKEIDRALQVAADDAGALAAKAELQVNRQDFAGAESTLRRLKSAHPRSSAGYYLAGQLYARQRRHEQALKEFEQALSLEPSRPDVLTAIVSTELARGRPEAAASRLTAILEATPRHALAHYLLGEVYLAQKKPAEAERSLEQARELEPRWNLPYRTLASFRAGRGDTDGAIAILEKGLQNIPDDPALLLGLAETQERAGQHARAIDTYERVLARNPGNLIAANNLAALLADHKHDAAGLKRARELVPALEQSSEPALRDTAAWVYYRAGEADKAIALLKPVVEKAPKVAIFQYHLGMAYHKQGDARAAKLHLSKAVAAGVNFPGAEEARATLSALP